MSDEKVNDPVNHPSHYLKAAITIEPIELTSRLGSCLGQALQYVLRAPYKGNEEEDLKKAIFYLRKQIELMEDPEEGEDEIELSDVTAAYARMFLRHTTGLPNRVLNLLLSDQTSSKTYLFESNIEAAMECIEEYLETRKKDDSDDMASEG